VEPKGQYAAASKEQNVTAIMTDNAILPHPNRTAQVVGDGPSIPLPYAKAAPPPPKQKNQQVSIKAEKPRRTASGKLVVPFKVFIDGKVVDISAATNATSGRKDAVNLLARHMDKAEADRKITQLLCDAAETIGNGQVRAGPTLREVVGQQAPKLHQLAYRTTKGIWCERRGREVMRAEVVTHVPELLMAAAELAADAPFSDDGKVDRPSLKRAIQVELEIWWADTIEILPRCDETTLKADSAAGQAWRAAMIRLWTSCKTWDVLRAGADGAHGETASRASLISRAQHQAKMYLDGTIKPQARETWRAILPAVSAWWRPSVLRDGEIAILLAMRHDVCGQVGVELPEVTNQDNLTRIGERFGCLDSKPPAPTRLSGGKTRLAVLSRDLTDELLAVPILAEDDESATQ